MIVDVELWEAVWERSIAEVEIPDDEVGEEAPYETVQDWLYDNNDWLAEATSEVMDTVNGMDYELTYTVRKET